MLCTRNKDTKYKKKKTEKERDRERERERVRALIALDCSEKAICRLLCLRWYLSPRVRRETIKQRERKQNILLYRKPTCLFRRIIIKRCFQVCNGLCVRFHFSSPYHFCPVNSSTLLRFCPRLAFPFFFFFLRISTYFLLWSKVLRN
jgi:hypothetical protein